MGRRVPNLLNYCRQQPNYRGIVAQGKEDKKQYVKRSTFSVYRLLIENHILPSFSEMILVEKQDVQTFAFRKLDKGLSHKTVKDSLIVLKTVLRFGAKNQTTEYRRIDIKSPENSHDTGFTEDGPSA